MSARIIPAFLALSLIGSAASAAPAPRSFDAFVVDTARETGRAEKDVRDDAIDVLRHDGRFSEHELERIGRDERTSDEKIELDMVDTLRKSELSPVQSLLGALRQPLIAVTAGSAFDEMKVSNDTASQLQDVRFQEMPEPVIRMNLRKIIDADSELGKLGGDQKERLVNELLNGLNARISAAEIIKLVRKSTGGFVAVELPKEMQSKWVTAALNGAPVSFAKTVEGTFTLQAIARDFPPYGLTYLGKLVVDGNEITITDTDLIKATFEKAGDNKPARVKVLTGSFKANRVARDFPPYGMMDSFEMTLEKTDFRSLVPHDPLLGNGLEGARSGSSRSSTSGAHTGGLVAKLATPADGALGQFKLLADEAASSGRNDSANTVTTAYRIKAEKHTGETTEEMIERVVKFSLHRDFPITGDDGGYSFTKLAKDLTAEQLDRETRDMTWLFSDDSNVSAEKVKSSLLLAAHKGMIVLVGGGQGNNTMAEIVVVVDPKNLEFVVLMNSNFGSDN